MKVFLDTGAWLALQITNDINHLFAKKHAQTLKQHRAVFFTNHYVLSETYTRLIYDVSLKSALELHSQITTAIESSQLHILEFKFTDFEQIFTLLEKYADHKLSFTDATIIASVKEYQLDQIFTFDQHFRAIHLPTNPFKS